MKLEERMEKTNQNMNVMSEILSMMMEHDDCPIEFKIMKLNTDMSMLDRDIMMNKKFSDLPEDHTLKVKLLECYELAVKSLKEIKSQLQEM